MLASQWVAVGAGAVLGAWLRWGLGLMLNMSVFPYGTLAANLLGGFLMGLALAFFVATPAQSELRLFVMTGALGGLTTFSTFSAEALSFLHKEQYALVSVHVLSHVLGSLAMTALGFWIVYTLKN
jgi:fluoride exporter